MAQDEAKIERSSIVLEVEEPFGDERSRPWHVDASNAFDGDHPRYRCCCGHIHAMTGVQIIVALLGITVFFDMWQVISGMAATPQFDRYDMVTVCIRFGIGAGITASILISLVTQKPALLIPYIMLQGAGLAAGMVFFVAFFYISLFGDRSTALSFLRSNGHPIDSPDDAQLNYVSWLMVLSFAIIILLQVWLMSVVIACWRYLRDKRAYMKCAEELKVSNKPERKTLRTCRSDDTLDSSKRGKAATRTVSVNLDFV